MAKASIPFAEILKKEKQKQKKKWGQMLNKTMFRQKHMLPFDYSFWQHINKPHLDCPLYHRDVGIGYGTS